MLTTVSHTSKGMTPRLEMVPVHDWDSRRPLTTFTSSGELKPGEDGFIPLSIAEFDF